MQNTCAQNTFMQLHIEMIQDFIGEGGLMYAMANILDYPIHPFYNQVVYLYQIYKLNNA